jgi:hypothetical protein
MDEETQYQDTASLESDTEEQASEDVEETVSKAEYLKQKAIAERKTKQLEKAKDDLKTNQVGLTREEAILFAKGFTEDEVDLANKLAKINNTTPMKAIEDDYFKSKVSARKEKETADAAQLGPAGSGTYVPDTEPEDRTGHEKWYREQMAKAGLK